MKADTQEFYYATLPNGWTIGRFRALDEVGGVVHAVTTKQGLDVGLVRTDHAGAAGQLAGALGLGGVAFVEQVHGGLVLPVERGGRAGDADGLVSGSVGLGLMTRGADCPLILAVDPVTRAVGSAHASWRGTTARIAEELIRRMALGLSASPERIVACVCPSAGPCCYEVGRDVLEAMTRGIGPHAARFFREHENEDRHRQQQQRRCQSPLPPFLLDLWSANRDQLLRAGVRAENIHVSGVCTMCDNEIFPSHRREGAAAGRFAAVIGRL